MTIRAAPSGARVAAAIVLTLATVACGSGETGPAASSAAAPVVTPSPATSAATTPSPAGTPGTAATAKAVVDGLRALAADPDRTFRISFKGESRHTTDILKVSGAEGVHGDDAEVIATFDFPGSGSDTITYRRVAGTDWTRFSGGPWEALAGIDAALVVDPLAGARLATGIQYLGPVPGDEGHFRLKLTGVILHPVLIPASNLTNTSVTATTLVLETDATGIPVTGTWTMRGQGRVSGQLQEIAMDLALTFSKVGDPLAIEAP
jgi:hypothetical protein